jgi:hypothetical protein
MPTKAKAVNSLSGFLDSDDEQSDIEMMPTPESNQENKPAAKAKKGAKVPTAGVKRGRPASKRLSVGKQSTAKRRAVAKRGPLKDQTNARHDSDTEEIDEFAHEESKESEAIPASAPAAVPEEKPEPEPKKPAAKKGRPPKKTAGSAVVEESTQTRRDGEFEYTPTASRATKKGGRPKKADPVQEEEATIQETQQPREAEIDDDDTMLSIEQDDIIPQSTYKQTSNAQKRSTSRQPQPYTTSNARRRAGSASDTERGNDPALRRKLGDTTRKFESMELKYRNLRDVGIKEAEANFERLRKQSEERTRGMAKADIQNIALLISCSG